MELEKILTVGALDIELAYWWTDNPLTYLAAIVSDKGDFIFGIFPVKQTEFVSSSGRKAKYICLKDDITVRHEFGNKFSELDLGVWGGQNILGFDYRKLDKNRDKIFLPGSDNSEACKTRIRIEGFSERWRNNTSADLDTINIAMNYLGMFLSDNKLETIAELADHFFPGVNLKFTKAYTHEELDLQAEKAIQGDMATAAEVIKYNYEDTIIHYELTKALLPFMINIAKATKSELISAFNDGKGKLAANYAARKHYMRMHQLMHELDKKKYKDFDIDDSAKKRDARRGLLKSAIPNLEAKKGFFKNIFLAHMPFYLTAREVHEKDNNKKELMDRILNAKNPIERIMYCQIMDRFTAEILLDIEEEKTKKAYGFREKYGADADEISGKIKKSFLELVSCFSADKTVNYSNGLLFADDADAKLLESKGYTNIGNVDLLSVGECRVVYHHQGQIFASGIDVPSKKDRQKLDYTSPRSGWTNIEIIIVRDFIEKFFQDPDEAYKELCDNVKKVAEIDFDLKHYIFAFEVKKNLQDMSDRELKKDKANVIRHFDLKLDEKVMYIRTKNSGYARYDPGEKKFCFIEKGEKNFVDFNLETKKFGNSDEIDLDFYQKKVFGPDSKLSKLVRTAYGKEKYDEFKDYLNACFKNSVA